MPNVIANLARQFSDTELVNATRNTNAALDEWAGAGMDPQKHAEFKRDLLIAATLREEYRRRTGEVI